jgi:short-subunit dehydrogenase
MNEYLKGKSTIVTGASSGIGREIALAFSKEGANVLAVARRTDRLEELAKETAQFDGTVIPHVANLQDEGSSTAITDAALQHFGTIDILVNNAAYGKNDAFVRHAEDDLINIIQTNLLAPAFLSKKILPLMIENKSGHIVFVTSLAGKMGFPNMSAYSASKFGVEGLAESIRREVRSSNIAITILRPGVTDTEFFEKADMMDFQKEAKRSGKMYPASEVAKELLKSIEGRPNEIVVGSDKWFLRIMPIIPEKYRMKVLSLFG